MLHNHLPSFSVLTFWSVCFATPVMRKNVSARDSPSRKLTTLPKAATEVRTRNLLRKEMAMTKRNKSPAAGKKGRKGSYQKMLHTTNPNIRIRDVSPARGRSQTPRVSSSSSISSITSPSSRKMRSASKITTLQKKSGPNWHAREWGIVFALLLCWFLRPRIYVDMGGFHSVLKLPFLY